MTTKKTIFLGLVLIIVLGLGTLLLNRFKPASSHTQSEEVAGTHEAAPTASAAITASPSTPSLSLKDTSAETQEQVRILEEILASHNDNDPRMDKELRQLSHESKAQFREKYRTLPLEKRNDRGTIVFLLGRNLSEPADFDFMADVLSESPCLSLSDCSKKDPGGVVASHNEHIGGVGLSLAYPQMVALLSLKRYLEVHSTGSEAEKAKDLLASARQSAITEVSQKAQELQGELGH